MSYVQGFLIAVPEGKKQAYVEMAARAAPFFAEHGALHTLERWGDDGDLWRVCARIRQSRGLRR